jgi:hypothetical protein
MNNKNFLPLWLKYNFKFYDFIYCYLMIFNYSRQHDYICFFFYEWYKSLNVLNHISYLCNVREKEIGKIFIRNIIEYRKRKYVIFDNIYYTDYIYHIIISDICYLYYYKKFSSKCYLII